ncbi:hypothetical protein [Kitasatospora sp. GP82]|uniref:hypothetical protein n=1 Tax=Kitasatospora sp. GP82 TaxID=3035089 RepID=UPI0024758AEA|nr:hypothetical protein [Kitasatospora sp. GP82]MDH6127434.1 hypothetical protein [Kitasatospora sp. GP82]
MAITERLAAKILREFGSDAETVCSMLGDSEVRIFGPGGVSERILAAVIIVSGGDVDRFLQALRLMEVDWRDLLWDADLEGDDWLERVDAYCRS